MEIVIVIEEVVENVVLNIEETVLEATIIISEMQIPSNGNGAVDSVNGKNGIVTLNQDEIPDGTTYKRFSLTEKNKLTSITEIFTTSLKSSYDSAISGLANLLSTGSRLITSGEITKLSNTSGTNTGDQDLSSYATKSFVETSISEAVFSAGSVTPEQVQAVNVKIAYNQDNENFALDIPTTNDNWFASIEPTQIELETNSYLKKLGIYYNYHYPSGQGITPSNSSRVLLYKKNYGVSIANKYIQQVFFVKTNDINKFDFVNSGYYLQQDNGDLGVFTDKTVAITLVDAGIYEVRMSGQVPNNALITTVLIGCNISDGTEVKAECSISGFMCYSSNTDLAGTNTVTTVLPYVFQEIADNKRQIFDNKILSDNNGYYRNPRLYGKKINFIGDSLSAFTAYGYNYLLASQYNMIHGTYGVAGTYLGSSATNAMVNRYADMTNDADIVIVEGGTNDAINSFSLGVYSDTTTSTFYGSLHILCQGLINKYPDKKIGFITPMQIQGNANALPYVNAIIEVCAEYSIPILDMYKKGGFSKLASQQSAIYPDQIHPNAAGFLHYKDKVESFLLTL